MGHEDNLDRVILWTDSSPESNEARRLLNQTGIDYEERTADLAQDNLLHPPTLQTLAYRYAGLNLIEALATSDKTSLADILEADRLSYLGRVDVEESARKQDPNFKLDWPYWSVRY